MKKSDNHNCRRSNSFIRFYTKRPIQHRWGLHVRSFLVSQTRLELPTSCERSAFPAWASHIRVLRNVYINIKHLLACLISKSQMACFSNVSRGVTKRAAYITYSIDVSNRSSLTPHYKLHLTYFKFIVPECASKAGLLATSGLAFFLLLT